jgi:multiple sugar transport system permease protein
MNGMLQAAGLPEQPFFLSSGQALPSIGLIVIWGGISFWVLVFLAALRSIPSDVLQAAEVDGANTRQRVFRIILPLMKRPIGLALIVITTVNTLLFAPALLITRGGPELSTNFVMYEAYSRGFESSRYGFANAIIVFLLLFLFVVAAAQYRIMRQDDQA